MKFQKLSENKLKIILSNDELPNSKSFDDFVSDSSDARHTFLDILEKAYDEVGFNTRDYKIKIDALALKNGNFVFTVTRLVKMKNNLKSAKPKKVLKEYNSNYAIYKFESFEDFCNFCEFAKKINLYNLNNFAKKIELYLYNNSYYLSIYKINENFNYIGKFYSSITEFCKFYSSKDLFISLLKEKGKIVIKHNAIETCQNNLI